MPLHRKVSGFNSQGGVGLSVWSLHVFPMDSLQVLPEPPPQMFLGVSEIVNGRLSLYAVLESTGDLVSSHLRAATIWHFQSKQ